MWATAGVDPGAVPRARLEHRYWVQRTAEHFQHLGYDVTREHPVPGDGFLDLLAERPGERIAVEVETGKSDIAENLKNVHKAEVDRVIVVATTPAAVSACQRALQTQPDRAEPPIELMTWLDVS